MKKSDYQTMKKATTYQTNRFSNGLNEVSKDELNLMKNWIKSMNIGRDSILLDLGTGTGRVAQEILKFDIFKLYAVDPSKSMLSVLKENLKSYIKTRKLNVLLGRADNIPLLNESVDLITCFHVFKHLPNIKKSLKEISRVLKKDGYIIFDVLNTNSLIRYNMNTCYSLTEKDLTSLLKNCDLTVKEIKYLHPLGETIYSVLDKIGLPFLNIINNLSSLLRFKLGTKIFVLAQKIK